MSFSTSDSTLFVILLASVFTSIGYLVNVYQAVRQLPRIDSSQGSLPKFIPRVSVIIPAYNEEENIAECIESVLTSTQLPAELLEVWVVDDQSSDRTPEILQTLQAKLADTRLKLLCGRSRPDDQIWTGKNWACHQGAEQANREFFLFIDADVRLKPNAIFAVIQTALDQQLDFLTCVPTIVCASLVEWLVQPLMFINLIVSFNADVVKDPKTKTTYALGPFLLFRASTYSLVGGHKGVADCVAFVRRIKHNGFKSLQFLGANLASLRMYRSWASLWEGWTKVLYVGAQRSMPLMLLLVMAMLLIYTIPWIGCAIALYLSLLYPSLLHFIEVGLAGGAILLQYKIRRTGAQALGTSTEYWWLQSVGGWLIAVLAIASIIKTETGWGWTWRGRKLAVSEKGCVAKSKG